MGEVVIHAGRPKTGSTSLQAWLASRAEWLRAQHGIQVLVARALPFARGHEGLALSSPRLPRLEAGRLAKLDNAHRRERDAFEASLFAQLEARARRAPLTVVSSEALATRLHRPSAAFVSRLVELAGSHRVRVAYYVRPQHTALEAAWRQWGFRSDQSPSRFLALRSPQLEYATTRDRMREQAPAVSFEVRPFRSDLLHAGNVIDDFAGHFLGLAGEGVLGTAVPHAWRNRGLPLDVANALGGLPPGLLWTPGHGNRRLDAVRRLVARLEAPDSETARRSRVVLQDYAHRRFEEGNRALIADLGWLTDAFVAPVAGDEADGALDVASLDELWSPSLARRELMGALGRYASAWRSRTSGR